MGTGRTKRAGDGFAEVLGAAARLFPCTSRSPLTPAQLLQALWAWAPGTVEAGLGALGADVGTVLAGLDLGWRREPGRVAARPVRAAATRRVVEAAAAVDGYGLSPEARLLGALVARDHVRPGGSTPNQAMRRRFWAQVGRVREGGAGEEGADLVAGAAAGSLPTVVPRDEVAGRVVELLCRPHGRVVALVGPEGVGRRSVVADLAWRIAQGAVARPLRRLRPVRVLDHVGGKAAEVLGALAGWLDGATGPRWVPILEGPIFRLLLEHEAMALGRLLSAYEGAGRPLLLVGDRALLEHLGRRWPEVVSGLARVPMEEPPARFTEQVVRWQARRLQEESGVSVPAGACEAAVAAGRRVLRHRFFPAKAVDLLNDAVGRAVASGDGELSPELVRETAAAGAGIPVAHLDPDGPLLPNLERDLARRVVGQDEAIRAVAERLRLVKGNYDAEPHRPDGVFLFTGPSGVGKTEMAEALAEALFGDGWRSHLIRKHMSEYSEAVSVTKLISAAPGYEGHATTRTLVDEVRERPAAVLLLDEMEKAHPEVHTLFLQVFEEGVLTDARGRTAHFGEVTVVMTANVYEDLEARVGFGRRGQEADGGREAFDEEAALLEVFPRELVNRFSDTIRFRSLEEEDLAAIVRSHLVPRLRERLRRDGVELRVEDEVYGWLAARGESRRYGARHLARLFDNAITLPVVDQLHTQRAGGAASVRVTLGDRGPRLEWSSRASERGSG